MPAYRSSARGTSVYDIITDRIVGLLESGVAPWRKPWAAGGEWPQNLTSKREYRGVNVFLLSASGFQSPYWLSYKQAQALGGNVRKGERATPVVFWKLWERESDADTGARGAPDESGGSIRERRGIPVLRYYNVFNVAQCDGVEYPALPGADREFRPIDECEALVANMPKRPEIRHNEPAAFYRPSIDVVNMPRPQTFDNAESYYATLFHELTHSTGHESRLNRRGSELPRRFGDADYSREELVAEMGAAFLCGSAGIEPTTIANSASYLAGWIRALKGDSKLVVVAAAQAQKAADFILGRFADESAAEETPAAELAGVQ